MFNVLLVFFLFTSIFYLGVAVKYAEHLECFISCSTGKQNSDNIFQISSWSSLLWLSSKNESYRCV